MQRYGFFRSDRQIITHIYPIPVVNNQSCRHRCWHTSCECRWPPTPPTQQPYVFFTTYFLLSFSFLFSNRKEAGSVGKEKTAKCQSIVGQRNGCAEQPAVRQGRPMGKGMKILEDSTGGENFALLIGVGLSGTDTFPATSANTRQMFAPPLNRGTKGARLLCRPYPYVGFTRFGRGGWGREVSGAGEAHRPGGRTGGCRRETPQAAAVSLGQMSGPTDADLIGRMGLPNVFCWIIRLRTRGVSMCRAGSRAYSC